MCKSLSVDSHDVMSIFCQDKKLNISPAYLSPGFAFGGSCLPKDLRALTYTAKMRDVELPIIRSILPSNELQIARGLQMITDRGEKKIGVLGLSFKAGTDDLRESPMIEIIERLIGKGYDLRVFDRNVNLASLVGANRDFILNRIPHISRLMAPSIEAVVDHAHTVVIGNNEPHFSDVPKRLREGQFLVDFARLGKQKSGDGRYEGICW
jgi:GDP-mannose 6-dehydrogenase